MSGAGEFDDGDVAHGLVWVGAPEPPPDDGPRAAERREFGVGVGIDARADCERDEAVCGGLGDALAQAVGFLAAAAGTGPCAAVSWPDDDYVVGAAHERAPGAGCGIIGGSCQVVGHPSLAPVGGVGSTGAILRVWGGSRKVTLLGIK